MVLTGKTIDLGAQGEPRRPHVERLVRADGEPKWSSPETPSCGICDAANTTSHSSFPPRRPDGTLFATAGKDNPVRLWDSATRQPLGPPVIDYTKEVSAVAFSRTRSLFGIAHVDGTIRIGDPVTGRLIGAPLIGHIEEVLTAALSPDAKLLAAASADATVRLWDPSVFQHPEAALRELGRRQDPHLAARPRRPLIRASAC